ncbi:hypothetical protein [Azospirillum brasilense]|uniref:hypothetical protein n=1 Tax=Azospirillum brasilense TaxID=192 RepID=UPI001EDB03A0|nr:hypothetical protein [Azospirillum brasilense]UKJ73904.1 hypothetical protein H1Q64_04710 [Azospirillum brasilense]
MTETTGQPFLLYGKYDNLDFNSVKTSYMFPEIEGVFAVLFVSLSVLFAFLLVCTTFG